MKLEHRLNRFLKIFIAVFNRFEFSDFLSTKFFLKVWDIIQFDNVIDDFLVAMKSTVYLSWRPR